HSIQPSIRAWPGCGHTTSTSLPRRRRRSLLQPRQRRQRPRRMPRRPNPSEQPVSEQITTFADIAQIRDFRSRATDAWQRQMRRALPEGWSISPVDFAPLVAVFGPLGIRPGMVLRAYQYQEPAGGHCIVFGLPTSAAFPEPEQDSDDPPPPPPSALPDLM